MSGVKSAVCCCLGHLRFLSLSCNSKDQRTFLARDQTILSPGNRTVSEANKYDAFPNKCTLAPKRKQARKVVKLQKCQEHQAICFCCCSFENCSIAYRCIFNRKWLQPAVVWSLPQGSSSRSSRTRAVVSPWPLGNSSRDKIYWERAKIP